MSTRSRVGFENQDGTITSIYVHADGDELAPLLKAHYQDEAKIKQLIELGDLSALRSEIGVQRNWTTIDEGCIAYHRDRGEPRDQTKAATHTARDWPNTNQAFEYLWRGGKWHWRRARAVNPPWREV